MYVAAAAMVVVVLMLVLVVVAVLVGGAGSSSGAGGGGTQDREAGVIGSCRFSTPPSPKPRAVSVHLFLRRKKTGVACCPFGSISEISSTEYVM